MSEESFSCEKQHRKIQGAGVSARAAHLPTILHEKPDVAWFELMVDNSFAQGGLDYSMFEALADHYPVVLHGVQLSLGSFDGLDLDYVKKVIALKKRLGAVWYSEHCSFSGFNQARSPDLFPLPYTEEALELMTLHIMQVQNELQEPLLLENISYYHHNEPEKEAVFFSEIVHRTGCRVLLDVNNLYVNSINFGYSVDDFLACVPLNQVDQIHVAGHSRVEDKDGRIRLIDTHSGVVSEEVFSLLKVTLQRYQEVCGSRLPAVNLEWDADIPSWSVMLDQIGKIASVFNAFEHEKKLEFIC